jgi:hypothetical protein
MKFARYVFLIAGIYGLLVLVPMYFMEQKQSTDFPPPITHPEFYYGFLGVAVAWQVAFLVLATDPKRYRLMIIPAILEKASFAIPVIILYLQNRVSFLMVVVGLPDLFFGVLFVVALLKIWRDRSSTVPTNAT